jgi:hypothetical protein
MRLPHGKDERAPPLSTQPWRLVPSSKYEETFGVSRCYRLGILPRKKSVWGLRESSDSARSVCPWLCGKQMLGMDKATFYYDPANRRRSFQGRVPTPPPESVLKLCRDGMTRRFHLAGAVRNREGDYIRIDYESARQRNSTR